MVGSQRTGACALMLRYRGYIAVFNMHLLFIQHKDSDIFSMEWLSLEAHESMHSYLMNAAGEAGRQLGCQTKVLLPKDVTVGPKLAPGLLFFAMQYYEVDWASADVLLHTNRLAGVH